MNFEKIRTLDVNDEIEKIFPREIFLDSNLDYSVIDKHIREWEIISEVGQSGVFVFDCSTHKFLYVSEIGLELFGLKREEFMENGHESAFHLMHPDDIELNFQLRSKAYTFLQSLPSASIKDYKLVHEFRLRNLENKYVRVTEQERVIALDEHGNPWLMLSVFNIDAGEKDGSVRCHIYNLSTGEQVFVNLSDTLEDALTVREIEILKLIGDGLLSKEISSLLGISINTVNVHRQNILGKLQVNNTIEAVKRARILGVLD